MTGGVASLFHGATAAIDHFDPDLTIRARNRADADVVIGIRGTAASLRPYASSRLTTPICAYLGVNSIAFAAK